MPKPNRIGLNTVIHDCVILGENITIGANCTIGGDGFAFDRSQTPCQREQFTGNVAICDNVEIGNNCNIDRGREQTFIGVGVKIDSLCHIAHDCRIGNNAVIAGGTILGGHAVVGAGARIGLNATMRNRAIVDDGAVVGMHTAVLHRVKEKKTVW
jgi:UDP-3-O-[3-hydroxymyristoyl] glucosamine N-acyltransferase